MSASAGLAKVLDDMVEHLRSHDIRAATDPAQVNLPGVWVWLAGIDPNRLDGNGDVRLQLNLITADLEARTVLMQLDELLGQVLDVVDSEGDIIPVSVVLPGTPNTLPGLQLTTLQPYERTETP
jgi:hypothetical protein